MGNQYELIIKGSRELYTVLRKRTGMSKFGPNGDTNFKEQFPNQKLAIINAKMENKKLRLGEDKCFKVNFA